MMVSDKFKQTNGGTMNKFFKLMILAALTTSAAFAGNLDLEKSVLKWKASKGAAGFKLGGHNGKIKLLDGDVQSKNGKLLGGNFIVDMANFTVEDLSGEWADKFITHMKSADFFDVKNHPKSKLRIKSSKGNTLLADLTINGITKPIKFDYEKYGEAFKGKLVFDRTDFNILYGKDSSLGDKFIHHEVELEFIIQKK
jgi:polyisoprenoid-binding protein YceI